MPGGARKSAANMRPDGRPVGSPFGKGNPGRPKGSRNKLSEAFLEAMAEDFEAHGRSVIEIVRVEKPDQYLKVVASLLPKDVNLTVDPFDQMSDDELDAAIRILKATIAEDADEEDASDDGKVH